MEDALDNLTISDSGRNIGEALRLARTDLFNQSNEERNEVRNILIVIADGGSDNNISKPSDALKEDGVVTFSVGIGGYVFSQLNEIASDPDSDHVFTNDSYDGLGPIMATLKDAIIRGWYRQTLLKNVCLNFTNNDPSCLIFAVSFPVPSRFC